MLKTSKNAELVEERERQRRVNNIIIYGMSEERDKDNIQIQEHDKDFRRWS